MWERIKRFVSDLVDVLATSVDALDFDIGDSDGND